MQDMRTELLALHNNLNEANFDLFEFLDSILAINDHYNNEDIFSCFCNIWGTNEAKEWDELDEDTNKFVSGVHDAPYVDVEKYKEMYFGDIKSRLEEIITKL